MAGGQAADESQFRAETQRDFSVRNPLPPERQSSLVPSRRRSSASSSPIVASPSDPSYTSAADVRQNGHGHYDHNYNCYPNESSDDDRPLSNFVRNYAPGRPLIEQVSNQWRNNADSYYDDHSDDEAPYFSEKEGWQPADWLVALHPSRIPRRVKRYIVIWLLLIVSLWASWKTWLRPKYIEHTELESLFEQMDHSNSDFAYGINKSPGFPDMIQYKKLDSTLLPTPGDGGRRLVFVGDVHGCKDELVDLLDKISFRSSHDHLILTGDIVNKGPDSPGTVDLARDLGASCVRGNHEDKMLLTHKDMQRNHHELQSSPPSASSGSVLEDTHAPNRKQRELVKLFDEKQIEWLLQCPVVLDVGPVGDIHNIVVAHAGLIPGVPYERQDPYFTMNMRSMDIQANLPSADRDGTEWAKVWNHYMKKQDKKKREVVVYGHDSKTGLNIQTYSKGLDSACVKGEKLTAWVVTVDLEGKLQDEVVSVKCKEETKRYIDEKNAKKKQQGERKE